MYISLHNQTHYSILDALSSPEELFSKAKDLGMKALAITDHGTFAGIWESYKIAKKKDIKLIVGCEFFFKRDPKQTHFNHVILLAKNAEGYRNMLSLNFEAFSNSPDNTKRKYPVVSWELLEKYSNGTICLTACGQGILAESIMANKPEETLQDLNKLISIFGKDNIAIEVQANNLKRFPSNFSKEIDQNIINRQLIKLAKANDLKLIPSCNSHYVNKEDHETHDTMLAIGSGQSVFSKFRLKYDLPEFYLKSEEDIISFFKRSFGEDFAKEMIANSVHFADMCEDPKWIDPKFSNSSGKELPIFPVKGESDYLEFLSWAKESSFNDLSIDEDKQYLRFKSYTAFEIEKNKINPDEINIYYARIKEELETLEYQGFSSYMLIVADYLSWCDRNNVSRSAGRGSVGGSYLGYLLNIHKADSIKYGLIFERFQNKQKTSFPDIDADVSTIGRASVLDYVQNKYGKDNFSSVSNFNTITAKVYLRDCARVWEFGGSREAAVQVGNELSSIVPTVIGRHPSIEDLINENPLLAEYVKIKYPKILDNGKVINKIRAAGCHAAAVIIGLRSLKGLAPLRVDRDGTVVMEADKDTVEAAGFVKMDILGLSTLDIISSVVELIKRNNPNYNDEHNLVEAEDEKTYNLISSGMTYGIFQFGTSEGTIDLCKKIKPKNLEDLAIITTLARPAARDIRSEFIKAKESSMDVELLHPSLANAFKKTYGFGLFDESILQLGADVAGWNLNQADRIRKMIKEKGKNPKKDQDLKDEFIQSTISKGIEPNLANRIWDEEVGKFASYTFNKSHAILYSMISYQTAYLKAHYPLEFLIANLMFEVNSNSQTSDSNILKIKNEIRNLGVKILPPDINKSNMHFSLSEDNKTVITGFSALKSVGDDCIKEVLEKRPFSSFQDFMLRVDSKKVRANAIQAMAASNAFSEFKISRKQICLYISDYRKKFTSWCKKHDPSKESFVYPWKDEGEWNAQEIFALETKFMGESFSTPIRQAFLPIVKIPHVSLSSVTSLDNKAKIQSMAGLFSSPFEITIKKEGKLFGKKMYKFNFEDFKGQSCSVTVFPDCLDKLIAFVKAKTKKREIPDLFAASFSASVNFYNDQFGLVINDIYALELPPPIPSDFKDKKDVKASEITTQSLSEIEDELINEGIILD